MVEYNPTCIYGILFSVHILLGTYIQIVYHQCICENVVFYLRCIKLIQIIISLQKLDAGLRIFLGHKLF